MIGGERCPSTFGTGLQVSTPTHLYLPGGCASLRLSFSPSLDKLTDFIAPGNGLEIFQLDPTVSV